MELERSVGRSVKSTANLLSRYMLSAGLPATDGTTSMHGEIIHYLYDNRDRGDLFQRDVEQFFSIRRSTATGILSLMERNGILTREPVAHDARLKKLILTDRAVAIHERVVGHIAEMERRMSSGISREELDTFFTVMEKIRRNLE